MCESEIQARKEQQQQLWKAGRAGESLVLQLEDMKEGRGANRDLLGFVDEKLSYTGSLTQEISKARSTKAEKLP